MKKIFCAVLALAAMASCSKEYIVAENKQAIGFGEAFVDNGTRADYSTTEKISEFKVYGTMTGNSNTVQIFNAATVSRPNDLVDYDATKPWVCPVTQYWVPNATYQFAAIVDGVADDTDGLPETIHFAVADGDANKDLLYATASATTDEDGEVETGTNASGLVAFKFDHLLAKLQFNMVNRLSEGYSIKVTSLTVENVMEDGLYTIAQSKWETTTTDKTTLTFGESDTFGLDRNSYMEEARQILPVEQTLAVTVVYDIYYNDGNGGGDQKISTATKTGEIAKTFAMNTVYDITAEISGNEIKFTVEAVNDFNTFVQDDLDIE